MRLIDPFSFLAEWSDILRKANSPSLERVADNRADVTRMEQLNRYDGSYFLFPLPSESPVTKSYMHTEPIENTEVYAI